MLKYNYKFKKRALIILIKKIKLDFLFANANDLINSVKQNPPYLYPKIGLDICVFVLYCKQVTKVLRWGDRNAKSLIKTKSSHSSNCYNVFTITLFS